MSEKKHSPVVVAFIGVIGSGKNYQADKLVKRGTHILVDFKDALLDMAQDLIDYDPRGRYDWFKNMPVGMRWHHNPLIRAHMAIDAHNLLKQNPLIMTGRRLLQRLGTQVMRKRDKDYWVKAWAARVSPLLDEGRSVVVADCRFYNEVKGIIKVSDRHKFVFCDYRSNRYDPRSDHESEWFAQELLKLSIPDMGVISDRLLTRAGCNAMCRNVKVENKVVAKHG